MGMDRRLPPEQSRQEYLLRGRGKQVRAANHLGDFLRLVIDHHRELVHRHAVAASQHEIPHIPTEGLRVMPLETVVDPDSLVGHANPDGRWPAKGSLAQAMLPTGARVERTLGRSVGALTRSAISLREQSQKKRCPSSASFSIAPS